MMERRKALTLPFSVDKDNLMENPLRISMTCLSPDCGKLERQVPWTAFAGKLRQSTLRQKNGSMTLDRNRAAMITMEMTRRQPRLVLTDVLKTEPGQAFIERMKKSHTMSKRGPSTRRDSVQSKEVPLTCKDTKTSQKETKNNTSKSETPKRNQKTTPVSSQRSKAKRGQQNTDEEQDKEESKDIEEVIIGKNKGEDDKFAEVVDCGLSVSWEPTENTAGCDDFSPASIKDKWTDSEKDVQQNLKRKKKDSESQCNGTSSPKRPRESVLRLTGEDGRNGGPVPTSISQEGSGEDAEMENLDRCILQFTVGGDDGHDNTTQTSPAEPIVLSSDDEESGVGSQAVRALVSVKDTVIQGQLSVKTVAKQQRRASHIQDVKVLQVDARDVPHSVTGSLSYSCMGLAFSTLHCGGYQGKANGGIMIAEEKIIIPLTDPSEQFALILSFERKELRRYSVWEKQELEEREIKLNTDEEPFPAAVLMFCVSQTAATEIQQDLSHLCVNEDLATNTEKASPFVLLTLKDPLEGMEGALLRSLLDIDCLNSLANGQAIVTPDVDRLIGLDDIHSPVLSLDDSIALIRRTGLDSHMLSMLGVKIADPEPNNIKSSSHSDRDKNLTTHTQQETETQKGLVLEPDTNPEPDTWTQLKPKEDQKEPEPEHPSDGIQTQNNHNNMHLLPQKKKEEPSPAYTLCHRRAKGSYSVSLCKPDSSWTKYKHQGLARRLIQFPPPPLKGGISVTMEDLQCLDSGQYLNDVIIDFYLKYLLQNASATVAERSHIFSSFFYKQLTRRDNASEGANSDSCQRQRRHQRVKTWTRHVDIFKKDFLFVPVNQEAHWYLVVICFPGLEEPKLEAWTGSESQKGKSHSGTSESQHQDEAQGSKSLNENAETPPTLNRSDTVETETENAPKEPTKDPPPGPVNCTELTCKKKTVCKRPCILIMDSLKLSLHERVFKLLREYLQSEWEVRRGSSREFGPDQMKSSHCQVPLQDNSSDCGLYLLQYVECFLKDPVVHFDLPLHLQRWFPRQQVRRKRDEIRDLILNLHRHQNLDEA